jgi:hypothetical protein
MISLATRYDECLKFLTDITLHASANTQKDKITLVKQDLQLLKQSMTATQLNNYLEIPRGFLLNLFNDMKDVQVSQINDILVLRVKSTIEIMQNFLTSLLEMIKVNEHAVTENLPRECTTCKSGLEFTKQLAYRCKTCKLEEEKYLICKDCSEKCHKNHMVYCVGERIGYCDCAFTAGKCLTQTRCTYFGTSQQHVTQNLYACYTCKAFDPAKGACICQYCSERCHKGHSLIHLGCISGYCDCSTLGTNCVSVTKYKRKLSFF